MIEKVDALRFVYNRLVNMYNESENIDYLIKLKSIIEEEQRSSETLTFYVVRSKDGKYLRSKGYGGSGDSWVETLDKAKVWNKIGGANGQVTWWTRNYPEYGIPDVIPLTATIGEALNQDERVAKALKKMALSKAKGELYGIEDMFDKANRENERHHSTYSEKKFSEAKLILDDKEKEIENIKKS